MTFEPWKIDPVPPLAVIEDNEDGGGVCSMEGNTKSPEVLAKAHLIAAAPELLEALKAANKYIETKCEATFANSTIIGKNLAAIARAT